MADRSVGMDPPQYIPVSNDSEDCSLEPKACPEPSHACPDARAYPQRRPGSLRRTRFPGGDTGGHLRSGRIEPGRVQLQFPVPGGAVFRHLRSDDRTAGTASRDLDCVGPVQTGTRGGELRQGVHRRLRLRPQLVSAAGGFRAARPTKPCGGEPLRRAAESHPLGYRRGCRPCLEGNRAEPPPRVFPRRSPHSGGPRRRHVPAPTGTVHNKGRRIVDPLRRSSVLEIRDQLMNSPGDRSSGT